MSETTPAELPMFSTVFNIMAPVTGLNWLIACLRNRSCNKRESFWLFLIGFFMAIVCLVSWVVLTSYVEDIDILRRCELPWAFMIGINFILSLTFALFPCTFDKDSTSASASDRSHRNDYQASPVIEVARVDPWKLFDS